MPEIREFPFRIGADPEFNIQMYEYQVHASKLLQKLFHGGEHQLQGSGYKIGDAGNLGWDGHDATAEIRPNPSNSPQQVVDNIGKMFKAIADKTKLFKLSTLSDKSSVGGHVHLELPVAFQNDSKLSVIHKKMGSFFIPLMLGENHINIRLRNKQSYGYLTDYRKEGRADGSVTYEFRAPTAEWLTTPKIALATLAYLATVYNEIINHPASITAMKNIIFRSDKQGKALQELATSNFALLMEVVGDKIKKNIKKFEFYEAYKEEINYILDAKQVLKDKEKCDYDIMRGWELVNKKEPSKKDLLSKTKTNAIMSKMDADAILNLVNVQFNEDMNVAVFANALKQRIVAFNWVPKHNFFLFGMRKGIKDIIAINKKQEIIKGAEQLKTAEDQDVIRLLYSKMSQKLYSRIDISKVQQKNHQESQVLIGLPYEMRSKGDVRKFLETIIDIEKGRNINPVLITKLEVTENPKEQKEAEPTPLENQLNELLGDGRDSERTEGNLHDIMYQDQAEEGSLEEGVDCGADDPFRAAGISVRMRAGNIRGTVTQAARPAPTPAPQPDFDDDDDCDDDD